MKLNPLSTIRTMMFKKADFEDEIYRSMEKQLVSNQVEDKHGFSRIAKAIEYLGAAAEIFDQAGMISEAEETVKVLHSLATSEEELFERYPEATREHKCPEVVDGWSSIEDCLRGCSHRKSMEEHDYWEDKSRNMEIEQDDARLDREWDEDAENRYSGLLPDATPMELDEEAKQMMHLKHKDKVRERIATVKIIHKLAMDNISISDLAGFNEKDLHNLLEMSTPNQLMQVAKKISNVTSGKSSISDEIKTALKERDLSDPKVRNSLVAKLKTALKLVKVLA